MKQGQSRGRRIPFFCQLVPFWPYSFVRPNNPSDPLRSNGSLFAGGKEAFEGPEDLQRAPLGVPQRSAPKMGGTPIFGPPGVPRGAPRGGVPPPWGGPKGGVPPFWGGLKSPLFGSETRGFRPPCHFGRSRFWPFFANFGQKRAKIGS